jgi:hypothetical protein
VTVIGFLLVFLAALVWGVPVWLDSYGRAKTEPPLLVTQPPGPVSRVTPEEVRTESIPVIGADKPAELPSPMDPPGRFDGQGVFRVSLPEETFKASVLTLLNTWGVRLDPTPDEFRTMNIDRLMSDNGFSAYEFAGDVKQLRILGYPGLIRGRWTHGTPTTYAVLVNLTDDGATLLDPINGKTTYNFEVLQTLWDEEGTIYWRRLPGISLPLSKRSEDPSVKTIQEALRVQGLYPGRVDGILGPNTKRAIRFFRQKYGLTDDSVFDQESYMVLSRVMFKGTPRLQMGNL